MSGQYGLGKEANKAILKILKEANIPLEPEEQTDVGDGVYTPIHRDVSIHISSYDDSSEEYNIYVQID